MFILKHTKPEEATGKVADAYAVFPRRCRSRTPFFS